MKKNRKLPERTYVSTLYWVIFSSLCNYTKIIKFRWKGQTYSYATH